MKGSRHSTYVLTGQSIGFRFLPQLCDRYERKRKGRERELTDLQETQKGSAPSALKLQLLEVQSGKDDSKTLEEVAGQKYTMWDDFLVEGRRRDQQEMTLGDLFQHIKEKYNLTVCSLFYGPAILYMGQEDRLQQSVSDVVRKVTKADIPPYKKMLELIPSFDEDEDCESVPPIRYLLIRIHGQDSRLGAPASLLTLEESAGLGLTSTLLDIPVSLLRMLTKMSLARRRPPLGFSCVGSGHSGRSIQFFIRSAKLLSPRTKGCLFLLRLSSDVVQSSGSLASNDVQRSRQASEVDLGRIRREGPLFVRRQAEEETLTFLVLLSTTPSSCHEASE
ncbi:hypothetical protein INR49_029699 [Caranx melampygus]|nr:hypothetical protein INR49_029699 [Caranx melampygus]